MKQENPIMQTLTFPIMLTQEAHRQAKKFSNNHPNAEKAEQVYRNTLAVLAVDFYCKCMGIETDLAASDSWNLIMQTLSETADLELKNLGKIECRPVLSSAEVVEVPVETWNHRIGYIAVQLNESMSQANLIGFVKSVKTEELLLKDWGSLDDFLTEIGQLEQLAIKKEPVHLRNWLNQKIDAGWETVETIFGIRSPLAYQFRSKGITHKQINPTEIVKRGKILNLERDNQKVALFVEIMTAGEPDMGVSVEVYPLEEQTHLPQDLQLMILNEEEETVMKTKAQGTKNIQLQFLGEPDDQFSVKVKLGDVSVTEFFVI